MAKKQKNKKPEKVSYSKALGFNSIFANEKTNFTLGITLLIISILVFISFVSYFSTSADDQSFVLYPQPKDILNSGREFHNACGSWGAYVSHFFIALCFGMPAFIIPLFTLMCSFAMMGIYRLNLWKWFFSLMIVMIWSSVTFAKFINPLLIDQVYNAGGTAGHRLSV